MVSQTAEYALRAVVFLASHPESPHTTAQIAKQTHVPPGYLAKVMQNLGRAGLVRSQRGVQGGFVLSVDPGAINLLQVVSAVEPSRRIKSCPLGRPAHVKLCPLHRRLDDAAALIEDAFRKTTILEVIDNPGRHSQRCPFPNVPLTNDSSPVQVH